MARGRRLEACRQGRVSRGGEARQEADGIAFEESCPPGPSSSATELGEAVRDHQRTAQEDRRTRRPHGMRTGWQRRIRTRRRAKLEGELPDVPSRVVSLD